MPAVSARLRLVRASLCAFAPLAWATGCFLGGQGTDSGGTCRHQETELGSDEQVSPMLGFAPADVLSWAGGTRSVSARWNTPPAGTMASSAPGAVDVTFAIERARGPAVEVMQDGWCGVLPHLRAPVTISLASADGQLDERWAGALTAVRPGFARVSADFELARLQGGLEWRSTTPSVELLQPSLELSVTEVGSAGSFGATVQGAIVQARSENAVGVGPGGDGRLLVWPADSPCESAQVPREPGPQDAVYVDAIARAEASVWTDAEGSEYSLAITSADHLCEPEQGELALPSSVTLRSQDGVVDLTFDAWFVRDGDQLEYVPPLGPGLGGSPGSFIERFGDFGLDLAGYDHVSIELVMTLSAAGGDAELRIVGYRDECRQSCDRASCSGCPPATQVTLLERVLSPRS